MNMDSLQFQKLLEQEVARYKDLLETEGNDWIVKGFIDVDRNIYTISKDTKVVSKIIELILLPHLSLFAQKHNLTLELPRAQNFYPDLTFIDQEGQLFAVDFKSSYYGNDMRVNGLTLGSYWGYFRNREIAKNTNYPYGAYKAHLVVGMLYKQSGGPLDEQSVYSLDNLRGIKSVIGDFIFFVQPKWKIATDRPGSGNTRNIGAVTDIHKLVNGEGTFSQLGEEFFDDYWTNFFNQSDARNAGIGKPHYNNLESYKEYLGTKKSLRDKLSR